LKVHLDAYDLVAYEVGTDNEVLNWANVVPTRRFYKGDVIIDGGTKWEVFGVRSASTELLWLVDVKKVT
jgi:hypothetical protein